MLPFRLRNVVYFRQWTEPTRPATGNRSSVSIGVTKTSWPRMSRLKAGTSGDPVETFLSSSLINHRAKFGCSVSYRVGVCGRIVPQNWGLVPRPPRVTGAWSTLIYAFLLDVLPCQILDALGPLGISVRKGPKNFWPLKHPHLGWGVVNLLKVSLLLFY